MKNNGYYIQFSQIIILYSTY